jgi:hypothetical protein
MSEQPEASPTTGRVDDGRTDTPSGALKQVDAGLLSVGYAAYEQLATFYARHVAYALIMSARPQTLYGLADSPADLAGPVRRRDAGLFPVTPLAGPRPAVRPRAGQPMSSRRAASYPARRTSRAGTDARHIHSARRSSPHQAATSPTSRVSHPKLPGRSRS